jgi:predicted transcriptional regulator
MPKTRMTVTIDPDVRERAEREARRRRVSNSWLTEEALRTLLRRTEARPKREPGSPPVPAA